MKLSDIEFLRRTAHRAVERVAATDRRDGVGDVNHIIAARHEFANAFGDLAKGKRNWQVVAFATLGLLGVVTVAHIRLAASARVVPYVVQVDKLGQIVASGPAEELKTPDERLVSSQLAHFVRTIRTVLPAPAVQAQAELLKRGYAFVAPEAAGFLNGYFSNPKHDPRVLGTGLTRQVEITSVLRVPKSPVWKLRWTEAEFPTQVAGEPRTTEWEGYVTVKLVPPATAEVIQDNPLGLYVTSINWAQIAEHEPARSGAL